MINSLFATNYLDWIKNYGNPSDQRLLFGFLPAYPLFIFSGILLVIIFSVWNLKKRGIPLLDFELGLVIAIPIGILGASIFGKIFIPNITWYHIFFFWEPGMSLFGSFAFGFIASIVWFHYRSQSSRISLWVYADCIVPNILLGQMIGRWGNFYNHEILGNITSYENLKWLPSFIRNQLFYFPNLSGFELENNWWTVEKLPEALKTLAQSGPFEGFSLFEVLTAVDPLISKTTGLPLDAKVIPYGTILYRQPLFLIEGIGNLGLWVVIRFGLNNWTKVWSKPAPWVLDPHAYPGRFNKKYRFIQKQELENHQTQLPIRYYHAKSNQELVALTRNQAWNKAYYWYEPELIKVEQLINKQHQNQQQIALNDKKMFKQHNRWWFKTKLQFKRLIQGNPIGKELELLHNPYQYKIMRAGTLASSYFIGYLILRIILETQRTTTELMIPHHPIATFILLSLILILGVILFIIAQWIAPYRYREIGWLYEKSY